MTIPWCECLNQKVHFWSLKQLRTDEGNRAKLPPSLGCFSSARTFFSHDFMWIRWEQRCSADTPGFLLVRRAGDQLHTQCIYMPRVKNLLRCSVLYITAASQTLLCLQILGDSVGLRYSSDILQVCQAPRRWWCRWSSPLDAVHQLGFQGTQRRCWRALDVSSNNNASKFIFLWSVESTAFWIQVNLLLHICC